MRRLWKILGVASLIAIVGVVSVGRVVYAQDDGSGGPFDFGGRFREAIAGILGISIDEYDAAVEKARGQVVDEALEAGWLTEEQAEMLQWRLQQDPVLGFQGIMPKGMGGPGRGIMGRGSSLISIAADSLGMSASALLTELQDGKTVAEVAGEKGVDLQDIVDAYMAQLKESLDDASGAANLVETVFGIGYCLADGDSR